MSLVGKIIDRIITLKVFSFLPDSIYLKIRYRATMGKKLDFKKPKSFNEKLQWLKTHNRNPEYTKMVDKYEVREYISEKIGEEYLIPLLGVWDSVDEIDFDSLPNEFVLKCTHDSGGLVICKDKSSLNIDEAKEKLRKCLKTNFYYRTREWPYKNVKPRIIAEKYMVDDSGKELKDYKFFCFNGTPEIMFIATGRPYDTRFDFFDIEFKHYELEHGHPMADKTPIKPLGFDEMVRLSKILSKDIPHVRIDFYDVNGKVYFGEITFFHHGGFVPFEPEEWDIKLGNMMKL